MHQFSSHPIQHPHLTIWIAQTFHGPVAHNWRNPRLPEGDHPLHWKEMAGGCHDSNGQNHSEIHSGSSHNAEPHGQNYDGARNSWTADPLSWNSDRAGLPCTTILCALHRCIVYLNAEWFYQHNWTGSCTCTQTQQRNWWLDHTVAVAKNLLCTSFVGH